MSSTRTESSGERQVRARPRWLKALGLATPPETLEIAGVPHRLRETFKHDSWAATALYEGPGRELRIVKLHRQVVAPGHSDGLGRAEDGTKRDAGCSRAWPDLNGIPALAGPVRAGEDRARQRGRPRVRRRPSARQSRAGGRHLLPRAGPLASGHARAADRLCRPAQAGKHHRHRGRRALPDRLPDQPPVAELAAHGAALQDLQPERRLPPHEALVPLPPRPVRFRARGSREAEVPGGSGSTARSPGRSASSAGGSSCGSASARAGVASRRRSSQNTPFVI